MNLGLFLQFSIMILCGMAMGRLVKLIRLPNVTGYLLAGLLIGPAVIGLLSEDFMTQIAPLSEMALGFIAFSIGTEFKISYFKRVGTLPIVIAFFEASVAVAFVLVGLLALRKELSFSLMLASIAAATAPAATVMVIKQYRAKGPVTETLLSVVAIDDAVALILFSLASAAAQMLGPSEGSLASVLVSPLIEIGGGVLVGGILGGLFALPLRWFKKDGNRLALTVAFVFAGIGLSSLFHFSSLLFCMSMGAVLTNITTESGHIARLCDGVTPPIFLLFFVASGADLQLSALPAVGVIGLIYIVFRSIGKMVGSSLGAWLCKAPKAIKIFLGPCLLPQAGVAIGLSLAATQIVPAYGAQIRTVILCGTLIYELIGPAVTKLSLKKAGEIKAAE